MASMITTGMEKDCNRPTTVMKIITGTTETENHQVRP
jgi:hypothetical protein